MQWRALERSKAQPPVIGNITTGALPNLLRRLSTDTDVTVIDLSGASDVLAAMCFGLSDLVLVPLQGSAMDARGATKALDLVRYVAENAHAPVRQAILLSRVSPIAATRSLRFAIDTLRAAKVRVLETPLVERGAYRAVFDHGGSLADLPDNLGGNIANARANVARYADDVLALMEADGAGQGVRLSPRSASASRAPTFSKAPFVNFHTVPAVRKPRASPVLGRHGLFSCQITSIWCSARPVFGEVAFRFVNHVMKDFVNGRHEGQGAPEQR